MANLFNSIKIKNPKRNAFNLSHSSKLTTEFGRLTPILCEPVLPADKFRVNTTLKIRFAPMTFPVMERFKAYVHYFFVPNRLIWSNWETFITGGESGVEDLEHPYPYIEVGSNLDQHSGDLLVSNFFPGTLYDYLGMPTITAEQSEDGQFLNELARFPKKIDALPFKAYQLIYDNFYRDQNLEPALELYIERDGNQDNDDSNAFENNLMQLRYSAWRKDYFTSALPDPQRGPDVTLPLFGKASVVIDRRLPLILDSVRNQDGLSGGMKAHTSGGNTEFMKLPDAFDNDDTVAVTGYITNDDLAGVNMHVPTEELQSASINDVRRGFALQRLYELAARVGGRYFESILGNFGVHAGDTRMQRPEFLGGATLPIYVGDVLQTSESTSDGTPLGMPAGVAGALGRSNAFTRTFKEHGWIIGILRILPEATYMQGMPRKFLKRDRLDFAWPLLANIGEQQIEDQELYFDWTSNEENQKHCFGYTPRYAEYRFGLSGVHGDFRTTLVDFHDARIFDSRPALNEDFIMVKPESGDSGLNRIFAVQNAEYDHLWVHLHNDVKVLRKLPKYGTPI